MKVNLAAPVKALRKRWKAARPWVVGIGAGVVAVIALVVLVFTVVVLREVWRGSPVATAFTRVGGPTRVETAVDASHFWLTPPPCIEEISADADQATMFRAAEIAMANDAPLLFTSGNPKRRLLVRTTIDNWQEIPLISPNPARVLVGPTIDNSQPQAIVPPPCPAKGYAAGVSRVSTLAVSNQLLGYRLPVKVRGTLARVVVFAVVRGPRDSPDVAVGLALAAHLAKTNQEVSLVAVPRYVEADHELEEKLRDQRALVEGGVVLGSAGILSEDTQGLLRQVLTATDRQGFFRELQADLGSFGSLVAALLALLGLGAVTLLALDIRHQVIEFRQQVAEFSNVAGPGPQVRDRGSAADTADVPAEDGQDGSARSAAVGSGLILAGTGVAALCTVGASGLVRAAGGTAGLAAALAGVIVVVDRARQRRKALHARDDVLRALVAELSNQGSLFDALLPTSAKPAPFRGRQLKLARLGQWWDDPEQLALVVTGPAGTGKTRLVTEFAKDRPDPWVKGWLASGRGAEAVAAIRARGDPALILVDDADQRPDLAALLTSLTAARGTRPAIRVILISRAPGLVSRVAATLDDRSRGMLEGIGELTLGPFGGAKDRASWFADAVRAYAAARQTPLPDPLPRFSSYATNPVEPILTLHAQALLAVLDSERPHPTRLRAKAVPFDRIAAALFAHEQHRWQTSAQQPESGVTDLMSPVQDHVIAALLLAGPADQAQAVAVLHGVPELAETSAERRANIARWAAHLYPAEPPWPIRIKPEMLAEWFAVTQVTQAPVMAGLLRVMTPPQAAALLVLLAHASDRMFQAVQLFANVVAADTPRLAEAAVAAALTASTHQPQLDNELAILILRATLSADDLGRVEGKLTESLPLTRAAAAEVRVKIARADCDAADLADALNSRGVRLTELGQYQEALAVTKEAIGLWRQLARDSPANQANLARALGNLGVALGQLGHPQQALAATEEADGLWQMLARKHPGQYQETYSHN